jgi:hypothetical protein
MFKKRLLLATLLLSITSAMIAQKSQSFVNQNAWISHTITWSIAPKLSMYQEVQWRRNEYFNFPQQTLLRAGVTRDFGNGLSATVGYGYFYTSAYGEIPVKASFTEHRAWEQIQQKNTHQNFEFITRLRLEQRWIETPGEVHINNTTYQPNDMIYSNRARFMEKVNIALNQTDQPFQNNCIYLSLMDECFASFGTNVTTNVFDQNRAFVGIGYVVPKLGRLELGYLNQTINKGYGAVLEDGESRILNKREVNHTLSLALYTTIKTWKADPNKK